MATGQVRVGMAGREFAALARDLRRSGRGGLRAELTKALRAARTPVVRAIRDSATSTLPSRGGLAARVASSTIEFRTMTGRDPGVQITATEPSGQPIDLAELEGGVVRHPVCGNRNRWVSQRVPAQWFSRPIEQQSSTFEAALDDAVRDVLRDLGGN